MQLRVVLEILLKILEFHTKLVKAEKYVIKIKILYAIPRGFVKLSSYLNELVNLSTDKS